MSTNPETGWAAWSGNVLAIVGSTKFQDPHWQDKAGDIIDAAIREHRPDLIISGGADGIDSFAVNLAEGIYDIETHEYLPKHRRWQPEGFKARNILIAENCTRLLAIRCHASKTYGSGWTADYAEKVLSRPVRRETL